MEKQQDAIVVQSRSVRGSKSWWEFYKKPKTGQVTEENRKIVHLHRKSRILRFKRHKKNNRKIYSIKKNNEKMVLRKNIKN